MEVLSHKVWLTCLSVSERKLLMQFLPSCPFTEQAVQSLLTGENLHFGNPFLKWKLSALNDSGEGVGAEKPNDYSIQKKLTMKMGHRCVDDAKYVLYQDK